MHRKLIFIITLSDYFKIKERYFEAKYYELNANKTIGLIRESY